MGPSNERRKRNYSKTQNDNGLGSLDPRGLSAQNATSWLTSDVPVVKGYYSRQ